MLADWQSQWLKSRSGGGEQQKTVTWKGGEWKSLMGWDFKLEIYRVGEGEMMWENTETKGIHLLKCMENAGKKTSTTWKGCI